MLVEYKNSIIAYAATHRFVKKANYYPEISTNRKVQKECYAELHHGPKHGSKQIATHCLAVTVKVALGSAKEAPFSGRCTQSSNDPSYITTNVILQP